MDYKYIEQLIERYFDCQTTLQEEQILRSFFSQEDVPARLLQYADLFKYETEAKEMTLDEEFDTRIIAKIEAEEAKIKAAKPTTRIFKMPSRHFAPFFKAAAVVAILLTIGGAAERAIGQQEKEENNNAVAVDPYIKSSSVQQAVRIKDVSKAETKAVNDSVINIMIDKNDDVQ